MTNIIKRISFLSLIVILCLSAFTGCANSNDKTDTNPQTNDNVIALDYTSLLNAETKDTPITDISIVNDNLTLGMALDSFGTPRTPETSSNYPLVYSWTIGENEFLYIVFETDNREEFMEKLRNGDYILSDESIQYGEQDIRLATDNELKMLREWIRDYKAVCAYTVHNKDKSVLFDIR